MGIYEVVNGVFWVVEIIKGFWGFDVGVEVGVKVGVKVLVGVERGVFRVCYGEELGFMDVWNVCVEILYEDRL